jgi:hypothetical protein
MTESRRSLDAPIGTSAPSVFIALVKSHPEIGKVFFGAPRINSGLRERVGYPSAAWDYAEQALKRYRDLPLQAQVKCLLSTPETGSEIPEALLEAMPFHQGITETRFAVKVETLTLEVVRELIERAPPGSLFSMCSQVELRNGSIRHIPMMDFLSPKSQQSRDVVCRVAARFGAGGGIVLESNRSYHYYGFELLSERGLMRFLANALLFAPVVDQAWIAHQLIDRCCALRIGPGRSGSAAPTVICHAEKS